MPVRVKPPPADIGEIISPGCAFFEVTMPLNGARMIVSSNCCCQVAICRSATFTSVFCCSSFACSDAASAYAWSSSAGAETFCYESFVIRCKFGLEAVFCTF
jgi:hypothetical protein